jgi:hypothetical protein
MATVAFASSPLDETFQLSAQQAKNVCNLIGFQKMYGSRSSSGSALKPSLRKDYLISFSNLRSGNLAAFGYALRAVRLTSPSSHISNAAHLGFVIAAPKQKFRLTRVPTRTQMAARSLQRGLSGGYTDS